MCVGFVNSGIMKLEQTVGIIIGAAALMLASGSADKLIALL